jgi:hypothetical protein
MTIEPCKCPLPPGTPLDIDALRETAKKVKEIEDCDSEGKHAIDPDHMDKLLQEARERFATEAIEAVEAMPHIASTDIVKAVENSFKKRAIEAIRNKI